LSTTVKLTVTGLNGFNSMVALSVPGLPAGVTATFTPASVAGTGDEYQHDETRCHIYRQRGPGHVDRHGYRGGLTNTGTVNVNIVARSH
jgi:hypothetical protein